MTVFDPDVVRRAMNTARIVKPASGDFVMKLRGGGLSVWSWDRRRACLAVAAAKSDPVDSSAEFVLPEDRSALMDSELESMSLSVGDRGMSVRFEGGGHARSASVKKRSDGSKRAPFPDPVDTRGFHPFDPKDLDALLRSVSCSALVKDTKTEEDMRVNQVHFYPSSCSAMSNARYYATVVRMDGLDLDMSVVSSDIPQMRSFCARSTGNVLVGQDRTRMFLADSGTGSFISFSRVASAKPSLPDMPDEGYASTAVVDCEALRKAVKWASMALEGTQRLTMSVDASSVRFGNGKSDLSTAPASLSGPDFSSDFPSKVLATVSEHVGDGDVSMMFGSSASPGILEIRPAPVGRVVARHFVKDMRGR